MTRTNLNNSPQCLKLQAERTIRNYLEKASYQRLVANILAESSEMPLPLSAKVELNKFLLSEIHYCDCEQDEQVLHKAFTDLFEVQYNEIMSKDLILLIQRYQRKIQNNLN